MIDGSTSLSLLNRVSLKENTKIWLVGKFVVLIDWVSDWLIILYFSMDDQHLTIVEWYRFMQYTL
jgi:hypothetical protein